MKIISIAASPNKNTFKIRCMMTEISVARFDPAM
jgi:hypothetical protein